MYSNQTFDKQQSPFNNLIVRYGKLVEVKIRASKPRDRAAKFVEDTCRAFDYQCENEMIRSRFKDYVLVTDKLFSAIFWQKLANNKTQKTNNNQIQNINDQKIACRWVGL